MTRQLIVTKSTQENPPSLGSMWKVVEILRIDGRLQIVLHNSEEPQELPALGVSVSENVGTRDRFG